MKWCVCRGRVQFYLYVLNPLWTTNILVARNRSKAKKPGSLRVENRPGNAMRPPFFGPSLTITRSFTTWYKTWWPDGLFALLVCAIPNKEESRSGRYLFVLLFFDAIPHPSLGVCVCASPIDPGGLTVDPAHFLQHVTCSSQKKTLCLLKRMKCVKVHQEWNDCVCFHTYCPLSIVVNPRNT